MTYMKINKRRETRVSLFMIADSKRLKNILNLAIVCLSTIENVGLIVLLELFPSIAEGGAKPASRVFTIHIIMLRWSC